MSLLIPVSSVCMPSSGIAGSYGSSIKRLLFSLVEVSTAHTCFLITLLTLFRIFLKMQNYILRECCVKWYLLSVYIIEMHKVFPKL